MNDNSFLKSYLKGEASYGFWNLVSRGIGIINTFIVIGALTLYEYGSFQLLLASYAGMAVFLHIGTGVLRNDILRFESEGRSADAKKLFHELLVFRVATGVILWAAVFFGAPLLSFQYGSDFIMLMRIISFVFIHDALINAITSVIEMRKKFNIVASRAAVAKIAQLAVLLSCLFLYRIDLRIVVVSLTVSMFVSLALLIWPFLDSYSPWRGVEKSKERFLFKILTSYGKWEVGEPILNRFTAFIETWAIKLFINTEAVAVFAVAQMIISTITGFLPAKTLLTLVPMEINDEEKLRRIYTKGVKYLSLFSLAIGVAALFAVPAIIASFFAKYLVSLPYFKALLFTLPLHATIVVSSAFLISLRRQKFLFFQKVLKTLVSVPLYLILLPMFGLWGMVMQNYLWLIVSLVSIFIYLASTSPKLFIRWTDMIKFNEEDRVFLRNIFSDLKTHFNKINASRNI